eukprot:TRINITY_DN1509_c0_g2_i1.p1 TRINITY_DN1509_c0_g2~~TRINITY_DN1509_c0_g2_i1.p1  ORF type:complete len:2157 (+),score=297.67 TRINITY_DN1509_c0_g2_i1:3876-10346(+)
MKRGSGLKPCTHMSLTSLSNASLKWLSMDLRQTQNNRDMMPFIHRNFSDTISSVDFVKTKADLGQPNHLTGQTQLYLKLNFKNVQDLVNTRNALRPIVEANKHREEREGVYWQEAGREYDIGENMMNYITEIREDDVLYHARVMIDNDIRCSFWYNVVVCGAQIRKLERIEGKIEKGDLRVMAFDIETTKAPLKFPDPKIDSIIMISYMHEGQGYLVVNRSIMAADIEDFTYAPKPEYEGSFIVFNEVDEKAVLEKFFEQIRELRPTVMSSFNGDIFDWPFIEERAKTYGISLEKEAGVTSDKQGYMGRFMLHMDCLYWVERDAYLPQGSHGLKAVTKAKLGYDPVELDPEEILPFAKSKPNELAVYAASDALSTYYLYKKMIHDFIFALCTIIPTFPDEILRLGSGTLCEALLMAEAFRNNIIFPNKHKEIFEKFHEGHLLDTETYIGGHVEALKNGVYRMDIPVKFHMDPGTIQELIEHIDDTLKFVIEVEQHKKVEICTNYTEVRDQIMSKLRGLLEASKGAYHECCPKIYHVDVAAMYPNIILTNRLQPVAIVNDKICASCIYNDQGNNCKRNMNWTWRGEYFPLNRGEYEIIKRNLETERVKTKDGDKDFTELRQEDRNALLKQRVKKYCERAYKRIHVSHTEERKDTVCMRENSFYVDTVRAFRDRRYEYKAKVKQWKAKFDEAVKMNDRAKAEEYENITNLYESLQLAHKIILNSFYGYVMRKGARWYSMQMAGMVTHLGGAIITFNREFLERVGIPLELDTDGIWCLLPETFPEWYTLEFSDGKKAGMHYTCAILNMNTYNAYANKQYQVYLPDKKQYVTNTEMSVSFEVDGPYRCIVLPAAREEGKMLKKKYAVFNKNGKLQELKGFEVKRRGELNIIKIFQSEVFYKFIEGKTLEECYKACADVAERWYDLLETEGSMMSDIELIEYIGEERRLSKSVTGYGTQKSTALTCARRLAEFLGIDITKDRGLNTKFIIAKKPLGRPVTERAIPTAVFTADPIVSRKYLRSWLKDENLMDCSMKAIVDWEYYKDRLAKTIQKIVTIPAVMQGMTNPFPKVAHPEWLKKKLRDFKEGQRKLDHFLSKAIPSATALNPTIQDIEDLDKPLAPMEDIEPTKKGRTPKKQLEPEEAKKAEVEEMHNSLKELAKTCPSPQDNFDEWLKHQQEIWKLERKLGSDAVKGMMVSKKGLTNYLKMQEEMVGKSLWHVLEITELPSNPGYLKVWFIAEHDERGSKVFNLFTMHLHIKRTFYINSKTPQSDSKQVKKTLPRAKPVHYLYEIESEEDRFLENYANFGEFLSSPEIEGIYEANIPLSVRAVMLLGATIRPKKTKIVLNQSHISQTFDIEDFEAKYLWNTTYLPVGSFDKIFISHSNKQLRHVWGIFLYSTKQAYIYCLHESIKQVEKPNLGRILRQTVEENGLSYSEWNVVCNYADTIEDVMNEVENVIQGYKTKIRQPIIVVLQSPKPTEEVIKMGLKGLSNDFPVIRAPVNDEDLNYPALNWQVFAAKNLAHRFVELEEWLAERLNFAKMAGLPVCNIEQDAFKYVIDMLFAKKLYLSNYVLWYAANGGPDLGGQGLFDPNQAYEDEIENMEIVHPGVYRGYCVELNMASLAIDTILKSDVLGSIETGFATYKITAENDKESATKKYDPHDIFAMCMDAFGKLKSLMASWIVEIQKGNVYADRLMQHIYRCISSPSSKMYDPALHRMIHTLMIKVFLRFIQRFKEYGAKIVYASFHKVIIDTGKHSYEDAQTYVDFVMRTLHTCDSSLYQYILLEPINYWRLLLFKDIYNYGGIQEAQPNKIASCWNIGEYLPPAVEEVLLNTIAQYIHKIYSFMQTRTEDEDLDEYGKESMEETTDKTLRYMKKLVTTHFSQKLFALIPDLIRRREEDMYESESEENDLDSRLEYGITGESKSKRRKKVEERWEFPENLASYLPMSNPALEFVKFIVEVFGLEPELADEILVLKRNLLKMLKIGEFSKEAKYENPSLVFVLQDVICDFCLSIRDIDICRDSAITKGNWICTTCNHSYNKEYIENKLIAIVQRRILSYQMQDLKCEKCKMIKTGLLGKYCECTGKYALTLNKKKSGSTNLLNLNTDVNLFILLMKRIAVHHRMDLLGSIIDDIFEEYDIAEQQTIHIKSCVVYCNIQSGYF